MILKLFESDSNVIFKPPRPLKSCKMHGRGIKNQKKTLFAFGLRNWPQKVAKKRSNWPPESIQNPPKTVLEFTTKIWWKTEAENTEFRLQNGWDFWRFLKSTSKGTWSPAGRQNWKFMRKGTQKNQKSKTCCADIVPELTKIGNSKHPKKQY